MRQNTVPLFSCYTIGTLKILQLFFPLFTGSRCSVNEACEMSRVYVGGMRYVDHIISASGGCILLIAVCGSKRSGKITQFQSQMSCFSNSCGPAWNDPANASYTTYLLIMGFVVPCTVIIATSSILVIVMKRARICYLVQSSENMTAWVVGVKYWKFELREKNSSLDRTLNGTEGQNRKDDYLKGMLFFCNVIYKV